MEARNRYDRTVLHTALLGLDLRPSSVVSKQNIEIVKLLIDKKAQM